MTTIEANTASIFKDARRMGVAALERMAAGDGRDAAEKAWCATLRATEALVLARTGQQPGKPIEAGRRLRAIAVEDQSIERLALLYTDRKAVIHDEGLCHEYYHPVVIERLIRETSDYVRDAERLARG